MEPSARAPGRSPAEIYDESFVPALFERWGPVIAEAAGVASSQRVLDVACGTGALTLAVARKVGPSAACSASIRIPRCSQWRGASPHASNGSTAAPSGCRSTIAASTPS